MTTFQDAFAFLVWAKRHLYTAILFVILSTLSYGTYEFVGGYASKFGESLVGGSYGGFHRAVTTYPAIDTLLRQYLSVFHASRIGIARFHNTVHDVGNNSLYFVSYDSIIAKPGVTTDLDELTNLPISVFAKPLTQLAQDKTVFVRLSDLEAGSLRELLTKRGVFAVLFVPIHDLNSRLIGMLSISWLNERDIPAGEARDGMETMLVAVADRIGAFISGRSSNGVY